MPSFQICIASIGRPSLQNLIDSLASQLEPQDCITIVYDGLDILPVLVSEGVKCSVIQHTQTPCLGAYGHGIRQVWASKLEKRDFVLHADDDDIYLPGAFQELRKLCRVPTTLYIAKFESKNGTLFPLQDYIKKNEIGTPNGIIPYDLNRRGTWGQEKGGDGDFYNSLKKYAKTIKFLPLIIYKAN